MFRLSRREFICLSTALSLLFRFPGLATAGTTEGKHTYFPGTVSILQRAHLAEMAAHNHYLGFTERAVSENYPNIAYLFWVFSISEKIHAKNYEKVLSSLNESVSVASQSIEVDDTRTNLKRAADKELEKIEKIYPDFLQALDAEAHEDAIVNCMYSWKSHRQHEQKIRDIHRYSRFFFGSVAKRIEGLSLDFHVCRICGSTIDAAPITPCDICNMSKTNYRRVGRPMPQGQDRDSASLIS